MKGAAMKLGQLLSFVDLDLPPEVRSVYHDALAKLRDAAPAFDPDAIAEVIEEEYGAPPRTSSPPSTPSRSRRPRSGRSTPPRSTTAARSWSRSSTRGWPRRSAPTCKQRRDLRPLARVISPNQEIGRCSTSCANASTTSSTTSARPATSARSRPATRTTRSSTCPTSSASCAASRCWCPSASTGSGSTSSSRDGTEEERQRVGEIVFRYAFGSIGRFRLFNGDPHPGNYLVEAEGTAADGGRRVAFLDYGSVKMFTRERYASMRAVEEAVSRTSDQDAAIAALRDAGFLPRNAVVDETLLHEWFRLYTRPVLAEQPFTFTPEYAAEVIRSTTDPRSPLQRRAPQAEPARRTTCCSTASSGG
jgi:hypothetical protein